MRCFSSFVSEWERYFLFDKEEGEKATGCCFHSGPSFPNLVLILLQLWEEEVGKQAETTIVALTARSVGGRDGEADRSGCQMPLQSAALSSHFILSQG